MLVLLRRSTDARDRLVTEWALLRLKPMETFHQHLQGCLLSVDEVDGDWSKMLNFL